MDGQTNRRWLTDDGRWVVRFLIVVVGFALVCSIFGWAKFIPSTKSYNDTVKEICDSDWQRDGIAHASGGCKSR